MGEVRRTLTICSYTTSRYTRHPSIADRKPLISPKTRRTRTGQSGPDVLGEASPAEDTPVGRPFSSPFLDSLHRLLGNSATPHPPALATHWSISRVAQREVTSRHIVSGCCYCYTHRRHRRSHVWLYDRPLPPRRSRTRDRTRCLRRSFAPPHSRSPAPPGCEIPPPTPGWARSRACIQIRRPRESVSPCM